MRYVALWRSTENSSANAMVFHTEEDMKDHFLYETPADWPDEVLERHENTYWVGCLALSTTGGTKSISVVFPD